MTNVQAPMTNGKNAARYPWSLGFGHWSFCNAQLSKVLQNFQALRLALFGMKLRGEDIVAPDGCAKRMAVFRLDGHQTRVFRNNIVRVHEIEERPVGNAVEDR